MFGLLVGSGIKCNVRTVTTLYLRSCVIRCMLFASGVGCLFPLGVVVLIIRIVLLTCTIEALNEAFGRLFRGRSFE